MLKPDRTYFENLSEKTGYQKDTLEKVYLLADLLKTIAHDDFLQERLVLKGGTAINFIYFNMPRLSVDIDLNFISGGTKENMLKTRENIDKILTKIFNTKSYEIEKFEPYALTQYNLKYINTRGNIDRIKLEINFMERTPVYPIIEKSIHIPGTQFKVRTYGIEELFATKLRALMTRATPRDLFDIYFLLKSSLEFDEKHLKKCFIFYYCLADDFRKLDTKIIDEINPLEIRKFLLPMLEKGAKIDLGDAALAIKKFTGKMIALNECEEKYIELFYTEKKADLDLLFEDIKYNASLKNHPMLKWKLKKSLPRPYQ